MRRQIFAALLATLSPLATSAQEAEAVRIAFLAAAEGCRDAAASAPPRRIFRSESGWVTWLTDSTEIVGMDARGGTSILTPWTGFVRLRVIHWVATRLTSEHAAQLVEPKPSGAKVEGVYTIRIAWARETGWLVVGADHEVTTTLPKDRPDKVRYTSTAEGLLLNESPALAACVKALGAR